ncbi:hypothetical protein [Variovorax sp. PAMC26660]|uniref:hypothetical protein n=1 Tax=Variovorax sp. PAMC26660 TaxID=2762322 RepID=UPI00164D77C6|nr:hypothetical protein [Variovorax sp. PAMC26660]QNK65144.1 hypothetical protein H7F35_18090 [Variovorax sp. PAMC26660]
MSLQGLHDDESSGATKVRCEFNGQSRTVIAARSDAAGSALQRDQAEPGNPLQIGAPMPGAS